MTVFADAAELLAAQGRELGVGPWITIDQDRIDLFAEATGDRQWIHVDPERAAQGPFGATVAHGYLTLSLLASMLGELLRVPTAAMAVNYGLDRVRFPAPVLCGSRVRARAGIHQTSRVGEAVQVAVDLVVEVEGTDKPACVARMLARYYFGAA